jgi:hypothetical protein
MTEIDRFNLAFEHNIGGIRMEKTCLGHAMPERPEARSVSMLTYFFAREDKLRGREVMVAACDHQWPLNVIPGVLYGPSQDTRVARSFRAATRRGTPDYHVETFPTLVVDWTSGLAGRLSVRLGCSKIGTAPHRERSRSWRVRFPRFLNMACPSQVKPRR